MYRDQHAGIALATSMAIMVLGLAGCGSREAEVQSEPSAAAATAEWTATIRATGMGPGHTGSATVTTTASGSRATVSLSGGSGGGTHPWHIHRGTCGSGGEIVGSPTAYPVLEPDATGYATATARLDVSLQPGQSYHINIHQSRQRTQEIVACGELRAS